MAHDPRGVKGKITRSAGFIISVAALAGTTWAFFAGSMVERQWGVQGQRADSIQAKLDSVQTELDVFLKYIKPEIDSIYQMSNSHELTEQFFQYGIRTAIPPRLLAAVARVESNFTPGVVSRKGASGVLQVMPLLWGELVERKCGKWYRGDSRVEICGGAYVLAHYRELCKGSYHCALSHYYSGGVTSVGRRYARRVASGV